MSADRKSKELLQHETDAIRALVSAVQAADETQARLSDLKAKTRDSGGVVRGLAVERCTYENASDFVAKARGLLMAALARVASLEDEEGES